MSEYDYYSLVFDNYLALENHLNSDKKTYFFQDSIYKLMEINHDLENEVFFQNAMIIISCLYHDKKVDDYETESQDIEDLEDKEKQLARSLLKQAFE